MSIKQKHTVHQNTNSEQRKESNLGRQQWFDKFQIDTELALGICWKTSKVSILGGQWNQGHPRVYEEWVTSISATYFRNKILHYDDTESFSSIRTETHNILIIYSYMVKICALQLCPAGKISSGLKVASAMKMALKVWCSHINFWLIKSTMKPVLESQSSYV